MKDVTRCITCGGARWMDTAHAETDHHPRGDPPDPEIERKRQLRLALAGTGDPYFSDTKYGIRSAGYRARHARRATLRRQAARAVAGEFKAGMDTWRDQQKTAPS